MSPATAQDLTLRMTETMLAEGLDKQLLPRFRFKHRIEIAPVANGEADMAFGDSGTEVFARIGGEPVRLDILTESDEARAFLAWLRSGPGKAAIESFAPDGKQVYTTQKAVVKIEVEETFDGDEKTGARLALVHCGRCHVVDERNRMGGIGSTPSFAALRGRSNWSDLFRKFFLENPHPSFTQVAGVTDPFDRNKALHVAPVEITMDEIEAITAFVATIEAKDLGGRVQSN